MRRTKNRSRTILEVIKFTVKQVCAGKFQFACSYLFITTKKTNCKKSGAKWDFCNGYRTRYVRAVKSCVWCKERETWNGNETGPRASRGVSCAEIRDISNGSEKQEKRQRRETRNERMDKYNVRIKINEGVREK
jgi:hypothetical protein